MPCRYDGPDTTVADLTRELDHVTDLLCSVLQIVEERNGRSLYIRDFKPEVKAWWERHKKSDTDRAVTIAEHVRKHGRLSDKQREALDHLIKIAREREEE